MKPKAESRLSCECFISPDYAALHPGYSLQQAGVFVVGGVIVGSHAFAMYGNMLGVRWRSETTRTQDVDIASDRHVLIGLTDKKVELRQALVKSELGFIEVPALDRKAPSTRFHIRGQQLSVDLLTPLLGKPSSKPIHISTLNAYAEPVRFLDYLLDDVQPAVMVVKAGILVNVPTPARYAFHKLVISQRRIAAMQTKATKDINQAEQLVTVLLKDRVGDLHQAWEAALKQPKKFQQQLAMGVKKLSGEVQKRIKRIF